MAKVIKICKGLDIPLKGKADKSIKIAENSKLFALKPTDFIGLTPKLCVQEGDSVKAGTPLFFSKENPDIQFVSPVSGLVKEIRRGERRKLLEVIVESNDKNEHVEFQKANPDDLSKEQIVESLLKGGLWPFLRQRPYAIIAKPEKEPKAIFISAFDSGPLAPETDLIIQEFEAEFKAGISAIKKLTSGKVNISVDGKYPVNKVIGSTKDVEIYSFIGPHPAGNIGTQINKINPVNKGEVVWYLYLQDVIAIGKFFLKGKFDAERFVALTGSEVHKTGYYKTKIGASISEMVENNVNKGSLRYISGNVLTGSEIAKDGFVSFYDTQVTVIPKMTKPELLGWGMPGIEKYSSSKTFISWLMPWKEFIMDTGIHGGERPFVMTSDYDKVFPLDIMPVQLVKAIIVKDIDKMEQLGIYEVAEEDFALCEYICPSKIEWQQIVREGITLIRKELE